MPAPIIASALRIAMTPYDETAVSEGSERAPVAAIRRNEYGY
jgi:hypothetical protein